MTPIFIISLKNSLERREHILDQLKNFDQKNSIEVVDAIDGQSLASDFLDLIHPPQISRFIMGRELLRGEIGCYLSHMKVYEMIINRNLSGAIILEDDVYISPLFQDFYNLIPSIPTDVEWINFNNYPNSSVYFRGRKLGRLTLRKHLLSMWGTYGYYISREGATKNLKYKDTVVTPIDYVNRVFGEQKLSSYVIHPSLVETFDPLISNSANIPSIIGLERYHKKNTQISFRKKTRLLLRKLSIIFKRITGDF